MMALNINRFFFLISFCLWLSSFAFSQNAPEVTIAPIVKIKNGDLKEVTVTFARNNEIFKVLKPGRGESTVSLPLGFPFLITFSKPGYVSRAIIFDTHVPQYREKGTFAKQTPEVQLEKTSGKLEDNYTLLCGKIEYSDKINDFDFVKNDSYLDKKNDKNSSPLESVRNSPESKKIESEHTNKPVIKRKDVKIIQQDTKKFTIVTINIDEETFVYKKEEYDWGGVFYYKDGISITQNTYENETEQK